MTTFGDIGLGGSFRRVGKGFSVGEFPPPVERHFRNFKSGYVSNDVPQDVQDSSSPDMLNVVVNRRDEIHKHPGVEIVESIPHNVAASFTHAGLDGETEMVLLAPPLMGVRNPFTNVTAWHDVGLPAARKWVGTNHGGVLVISDTEGKTYAREIRGTTLVEIPWGEAQTLASFAGRIFAGGARIGGVRNVLGFRWTGASGLAEDVSGLGSGYELLLSDVAQGDEIVALRSSGFDALIFLLRKSVWVGRRTGDPFRPLDVAPAVPGIGCVAERTAVNVLGGVAWLSDAGVEFFDGNSFEHLSGPIDSELLPLDLRQAEQYFMVYSLLSRTLKLFIGDRSWAYEFDYKRWTVSSLTADSALGFFNPELADLLTSSAGWGEYWSGYWSDDIEVEFELPTSDVIYFKDNEIGIEDHRSERFWREPFEAYWRFPMAGDIEPDRLVDLREIELTYSGGGEIEVELPLDYGTYQSVLRVQLENRGAPSRKRLKLYRTIVGMTAGIRLVSGNLRIGGLRLAGRLGREVQP